MRMVLTVMLSTMVRSELMGEGEGEAKRLWAGQRLPRSERATKSRKKGSRLRALGCGVYQLVGVRNRSREPR